MNERLASVLLPESARLIDAVQVIRRNRSRCAVVVSGERVIGVISEGDILRALLNDADVHAPITEWINHGFKFLAEPRPAAALELMRKYGITLVPVLDADFRLTEFITLGDMLAQVQLIPVK
jgi:CBS domain-containing protein